MKSLSYFEQEYTKLNSGQREAVDTIEGPVMVIAGPGTGKTTVLTLRIANILKETDTPPSGILAITYTDAGVKAMRQKLIKTIGNRAHEVELHTFHSFASAMIAEYPDHFLHLKELKQMTDVEQEMILREILLDKKFKDLRPLARPDAYLSSIIRAIDESKREALTPKAIHDFAKAEIKRVEADETSISTRGTSKGKLKALALENIEKCKKTILFSELFEKYEEVKREKKMMDWNDLIIEFLVALKEDELFLRLIQERFLYLLVDEHQDTNDAQNLIISLLAEFFETPNLFIVGDEKQAIYRFQGASVENFLKLRERWPSMQLISLSTNYRSHQSILDASFSMIEKNYVEGEHTDLRVKLEAGNGDRPRPIELINGADTRSVDEYLVQELKKLIADKPEASIAIITRRNRDVERIIRLLESHDVPVSSERSVDIFHHPIGMTFFDLLSYISDPNRTDTLARTIASGMWGLDFNEGISIIRDLRADRVVDIDKLLPSLKGIREELLEDTGVGILVHAADLSRFSDLVMRDPAYIHVWRGIVTLGESVARESRLSNPLEIIKAMLAYRDSAESRTVKVSVGAPDLPIKAMTAHGSKGLEFDYVFLPYATDESWIGRTRGSSFILPTKGLNEGDVRDIRRLFYVALTRARKHVTILSALEEPDGRSLTPLRFISELDPQLLSITNLERSLGLISGKEKKEKRESKIIGLAKDVLVGSGLSVTALNHFLDCPNKFIYESVLRMPQAPSSSAAKGTAMHDAISKIWLSEDRSTDSIENIISTTVVDSLKESLISRSDREMLVEELVENAPIVARALLEHFGTRGEVSTEKWFRANFGFMYEGEHFTIPLHGRLDTLIQEGENLAVYDYKTRQSLSLAEIKGETKSSDGGYFRQLVFYKILIGADRRYRNLKSKFSLVFVTPDKKGNCPTITLPVDKNDEASLEEKITSLLESVWNGEIASLTCGKNDCEYCAMRSILRD